MVSDGGRPIEERLAVRAMTKRFLKPLFKVLHLNQESSRCRRGANMFRIGEFSKLSQVSVKTLRYYDQIGLLHPAEVDRFTSYRYYSTDQLHRLNRILALKDLGLSLEQIGLVLDHDLSPDELRGMLRMKQLELEQQVEATASPVGPSRRPAETNRTGGQNANQ